MDPSPNGPRVWIVIVNWNGRQLLSDCLASLRALTYPSFRVVVVDNASTDGSAEMVRASFPEAELLALGENLGFAGGGNQGMQRALVGDAEYVLVLNNDTRVGDPEFLQKLVESAEADPRTAVVGPRVADPTDAGTTQEMGMTIDPLGFPKHRRGHPGDVFYVSGCAMLFKATALRHVGGFSDYFIFVEDVDLCWRMRLAGYRVVATDATYILHTGGATFPGGYRNKARYTTTPLRLYLRERNTLRTLFHCYALPSLLLALSLYIPLTLLELLTFALTLRLRACWEYGRAYAWFILHFSTTLRERRFVQRLRCVPEREILAYLSIPPGKLEMLLGSGLPFVQGRRRLSSEGGNHGG